MLITRPVRAVLERELIRTLRQRDRLLAAMARPLIWLLIIGGGFNALLAGSGHGDYRQFLAPGVIGMTLLFGAMLAALSLVLDKESGVMRMMIAAPFQPRWIVIAKAASACAAAMLQAVILIFTLAALGYVRLESSLLWLLLGLPLSALGCAGIGVLVAAWSQSLDNFATIMNFVTFPVFFLLGALYPVKLLPTELRWVALLNPFSYAVDLLKHAMLGAGTPRDFAADLPIALDITVLLVFSVIAITIASLRYSRESTIWPVIHPTKRSQ
jgi:ABC-2 type transport system permease protein